MPNINYRCQFSIFAKKLEEKFNVPVESIAIDNLEGNDKENTLVDSTQTTSTHTPQKKIKQWTKQFVFPIHKVIYMNIWTNNI